MATLIYTVTMATKQAHHHISMGKKFALVVDTEDASSVSTTSSLCNLQYQPQVRFIIFSINYKFAMSSSVSTTSSLCHLQYQLQVRYVMTSLMTSQVRYVIISHLADHDKLAASVLLFNL